MEETFENAIAADDATAIIESRKGINACVDAADWLNADDEPDNPLVSELIECGEVVAMVGQAKAGKSLLALQLAICVALGLPFMDRPTTRKRVYVANLEVTAKQYKKRLRRICSALNIDTDSLRDWLFIDNMRGETASWETALAMCKAHNCDVAIIDPFYHIARIVETDAQQCLDTVEQMKSFTKEGITLCIVFHSPKGFSGDRQLVDMISGSAILARFPESIIGLLNHAAEKTARVVDAVLRNYPPPEPFAVSLKRGLLEIAPNISAEVATARNAYLRSKQAQPPIDIMPYVISAISEAREDAKRGGIVFRGVRKGALVEKVRNLIRAEGKTPTGRDATANMIEGLPPDEIIITPKTADGVLIGTVEDMEWFTKK